MSKTFTGIKSVSNLDSLSIVNSEDANLSITSGNSSAAQLNLGDVSDVDICNISYDNSSNSFSLTSNTDERMTINSSGEVSLKPNSYVDLASDSNESILRITAGSNSGSSTIHFGRPDTADSGRVVYSHSGTDSFNIYLDGTSFLVFDENNFDWNSDMRLLSSGASTDRSLTIRAGSSGIAQLNLGDSADSDICNFAYNNSDNSLTITSNTNSILTCGSNGDVEFPTVSGSTSMIINRDQVNLANGDGNFKLRLDTGASSIAIISFFDQTNEEGSISYNQSNDNMVFSTNNTTALTIDGSQDATFAGDISANNFTSGTYTPTLTNVSNTSSPTVSGSWRYTQHNDMITIYGKFSFTRDVGTSNHQIRASLPVAREFSASNQISGELINISSKNGDDIDFVDVRADTTNDEILIVADFGSGTTGSDNTIAFNINASYQLV